jgi:hypothetical protein
MRNQAQIIRLLFLIAIIMSLVMPIVVSAQDDEGESNNEDTTAEVTETDAAGAVNADEASQQNNDGEEGVGLLMLIVGFIGIFIVGLRGISRDRSERMQQKAA